MGALLSSLVKSKEPEDAFIDFENARPSSNESEVYNTVENVLKDGPRVYQLISEYKGCQDLARQAMSAPTPENEKAAFEGLLVAVDSVQSFYRHSKSLEQVLPVLLDRLGKAASNEEVKSSICDQQALARQLASIFDFTLRFDQTRMLRPYLSNDFSYYRRLLPKFSKHPNLRVKDDEASQMALFTAEHIPMMSCLSKACNSALSRNENVKVVLSAIANACLSMLKSKKFAKAETNLFCARALTGAVVLYDHVDPMGVFSKKSPVQVKAAIQLLKKEFPGEQTLLNAIQYSTKTFKDAPSGIQELFK